MLWNKISFHFDNAACRMVAIWEARIEIFFEMLKWVGTVQSTRKIRSSSSEVRRQVGVEHFFFGFLSRLNLLNGFQLGKPGNEDPPKGLPHQSMKTIYVALYDTVAKNDPGHPKMEIISMVL